MVALEAVIEKSKKRLSKKEKQPSIYDFVGILTKKEASEMRKAIEETNKTIQPDDLKINRYWTPIFSIFIDT